MDETTQEETGTVNTDNELNAIDNSLSDDSDAPVDAPAAEEAAPVDAAPEAVAPEEVPADSGYDAPVDAPATTDLSTTTTATIDTQSDLVSSMHNLTNSTIQLMGLSFILGSLFTILILILLDFMRRNQK
jgi:hypothetical protein